MIKFKAIVGTEANVVFEWGEKEEVSFKTGKNIVVVSLGEKKNFSPYVLRKSSAKLIKKLKELKMVSASLNLDFFEDKKFSSEAVVEGILLGDYEFKKYKSKKDEDDDIYEVVLVSSKAKAMLEVKSGINEALLMMDSVNYARDLVNEPSAVTTPTYLGNEALKLSKEANVKVKVYSKEEIVKMGMEAFLGVSKGSDEALKLIRLEYTPNEFKKNILIAGKAITFDTGGLSLKSDERMQSMKMDMAGGAAILAIFKALAINKPKVKVMGLIAACENMPSGHAIKPGDIVRAYNGKTIEVVNTDAEGRLTLADVLSYGATLKPDVMIDLATLTGACMVALGNDIAGLFSTNKELSEKLMKASFDVGEKLWEMPLDPDYKKLIDSSVADLSNVGEDRYGGAITAALFLKEFVDDVPWAHLDIAGPAFWEKVGPYGAKGASGFGVRLILKFLEDL